MNTKYGEGAYTLSSHANWDVWSQNPHHSLMCGLCHVCIVVSMSKLRNPTGEEGQARWQHHSATVTVHSGTTSTAGLGQRESPRLQLYRQACMQSWSPPTSKFQVGGLQLYRHACLKYWSPPTSSTRLGGFKLARPSCMYTNQVHISVMSC